eukprot:COSAG01_NODE_17148_length_1174_cov_1.041860_1_plen_94_part_10
MAAVREGWSGFKDQHQPEMGAPVSQNLSRCYFRTLTIISLMLDVGLSLRTILSPVDAAAGMVDYPGRRQLQNDSARVKAGGANCSFENLTVCGW